jgi:hypothetical protein
MTFPKPLHGILKYERRQAAATIQSRKGSSRFALSQLHARRAPRPSSAMGNADGIYGDISSLAPTPSNAALLLRTKEYSKQVADILKPGIDSAREFVLQELFPPMLALQNGLQDGFDVLKLMLGESPSFNEIYVPLQALQQLALRTKMASFVAANSGLSESEVGTFTRLALSDLQPAAETDRQYKSVEDLIRSLAASGSSNTALGKVTSADRRFRSPRRDARAIMRERSLKESQQTSKAKESGDA